ncbi:cytochrome P450 302a1, mitochondrial isoform X2 [Maniola jurtina]|uniref:cytochrome P450 302a1, mitochondrial isoform X2 n=1 Tax=Maniola jurtina TaxID=191418 RepID=UPI001E686C51|nr:cytochrome P450 302a1, mitochondrial isoform X2 [Maniola jurtina]
MRISFYYDHICNPSSVQSRSGNITNLHSTRLVYLTDMLQMLKKAFSLKKAVFFSKCRLSSSVKENGSLENKTSNPSVLNFENIPGPKSYPAVGTLYKYWPCIGEYNIEAIDKAAWLNWRKYGGLVREEPGVKLLHLFEPDLIESVFRQKERYPARRSHVAMQYYRVGKPHVYNNGGLLSTNGPDWWRIRSAFQKKFSSPQNAKQYVQEVDNIVKRFIEWIQHVIGKIAFNEDFQSFSPQEQDPKSRSSKVIAAAFGSNSGIMKLDNGIMWRFFKTPLYRKLVKSQEYLEKICMDILLNRINFYEKENDDAEKSLLDAFIRLPNIDMKDLIGVMVDILMAAIDTTSYSTSFALYHMAQNQECQNLFFEEVSKLLPTEETEVTADLLSKAVYVRSCLKESLRLNPVSIGVGRVLQNEMVLKGFMIPKGTVIVAQNMVASRLPQYFKDPLRFKPERWIRDSENFENIHPFLSLPFGFGPRSCIARRLAEQNMCITLIRLIRKYKITWMGGELGVKTLLINKPDQPISLSFTPRFL